MKGGARIDQVRRRDSNLKVELRQRKPRSSPMLELRVNVVLVRDEEEVIVVRAKPEACRCELDGPTRITLKDAEQPCDGVCGEVVQPTRGHVLWVILLWGETSRHDRPLRSSWSIAGRRAFASCVSDVSAPRFARPWTTRRSTKVSTGARVPRRSPGRRGHHPRRVQRAPGLGARARGRAEGAARDRDVRCVVRAVPPDQGLRRRAPAHQVFGVVQVDLARDRPQGAPVGWWTNGSARSPRAPRR